MHKEGHKNSGFLRQRGVFVVYLNEKMVVVWVLCSKVKKNVFVVFKGFYKIKKTYIAKFV